MKNKVSQLSALAMMMGYGYGSTGPYEKEGLHQKGTISKKELEKREKRVKKRERSKMD